VRPDPREGGAGNDDLLHATFLGGGTHRLCDAWICESGPDSADVYAIDVAPGESYTASIVMDGALSLEATTDGGPGGVISALPNIGAQCVDIRGGMMPGRVYLRVRPLGPFVPDGEPVGAARVDYALGVVAADLDADPQGACAGVVPRIAGWPPELDLP
jgi:hypothetical protein